MIMKKIMFNDKFLLTEAVIAGRKTQTRRLIPSKVFEKYVDMFDYDELIPQGSRDNYFRNFAIDNSPYKVGDVVAIAVPYKDFMLPTKSLRQLPAWNNKMFVRADKMPFKIEITKVRVERLQEISDEDCIAEGIIKYADGIYTYIEGGKKYYHSELDTPQKAYGVLINKISGLGTWTANPWVFVYEFKLIR